MVEDGLKGKNSKNLIFRSRRVDTSRRSILPESFGLPVWYTSQNWPREKRLVAEWSWRLAHLHVISIELWCSAMIFGAMGYIIGLLHPKDNKSIVANVNNLQHIVTDDFTITC
jgi:hypothetical protein